MTMQEKSQGTAGMMKGMAPLRRFSTDVLASDSFVPVVLEFEQPPVAVFQRRNPQADVEQYQAQLAEAHQAFLKQMESLGIEMQLAVSSVVMAGENGSVTVTLPHDFTTIFNGLGVLMPGRMVTQVAKMAGVRAVTLNKERVYLDLDKSVPFSGAPQIWDRADTAGRGIRGEGVVVAVIDTGSICQFC